VVRVDARVGDADDGDGHRGAGEAIRVADEHGRGLPRSKPLASVALKVTSVRPSGRLAVTELPVLSRTPSLFVSQPVERGAVPPVTLPTRRWVAPVRNL
jgi:hypothetical protein